MGGQRRGFLHFTRAWASLAELCLVTSWGEKEMMGQNHKQEVFFSTFRLSFFGLAPHFPPDLSFYTCSPPQINLVVGFNMTTSLCFSTLTTCTSSPMKLWPLIQFQTSTPERSSAPPPLPSWNPAPHYPQAKCMDPTASKDSPALREP